MSKQTKRDFSKMLAGNDMYKNVQRENARNDFIKKLLRDCGDD